MDRSLRPENFDSLFKEWNVLQEESPGSIIFSSPQWTGTWWRHFGTGYTLYLRSVRRQQSLLGIAPLMVADGQALFAAGPDVCDYMDFPVRPGEEETFCTALLDGLTSDGVEKLDLGAVRPDSLVYTHLVPLAKRRGLPCECNEEDVTVYLKLPQSWDDYLGMLNSKHRHEIRRKLRRLEEMGAATMSSLSERSAQTMETFFRLFRECRLDKADFLTPERKEFIEDLAGAMAVAGRLRLNLLSLDRTAVAATLCFDYKKEVLLYNSGYDPEYRWLSAGLISKARVIGESIERGMECFNFLKGDEHYKYQLGGRRLPLYRCRIKLG